MPPRTTRPPSGTFALAILMHRERLDLSQSDIVRLFPGWFDGSAMPYETWKKWELGLRTPPAWLQQLVIDRLGKINMPAKSK